MPGARHRSPSGPGVELPVLSQPRGERADAARNRAKILEAAASIVATEGVQRLSVDEVARRAGVGVGTIYRRFDNQAGLVYALLDEPDARFQAAFLSGPPPLGPGAAPRLRLCAFLHALLERIDAQRDLLLIAEATSLPARVAVATYRVHHTHLVTLLTELRPGADPHFLADALLAALTPSMIDYQRRERGLTLDQVHTGLDELLGLTGLCS